MGEMTVCRIRIVSLNHHDVTVKHGGGQLRVLGHALEDAAQPLGIPKRRGAAGGALRLLRVVVVVAAAVARAAFRGCAAADDEAWVAELRQRDEPRDGVSHRIRRMWLLHTARNRPVALRRRETNCDPPRPPIRVLCTAVAPLPLSSSSSSSSCSCSCRSSSSSSSRAAMAASPETARRAPVKTCARRRRNERECSVPPLRSSSSGSKRVGLGKESGWKRDEIIARDAHSRRCAAALDGAMGAARRHPEGENSDHDGGPPSSDHDHQRAP